MACFREVNVTQIPKGPPSSSVFLRPPPISISILLSKVFERLVLVHLGQFMECCGVLPNTQFAYRKGLGTSDALMCVSQTLRSALESGQDARIVQIDINTAFDRVNHQRIIYKLCSVGIADSVLSILTDFYQINHSMLRWMVVRVLVNIVSGLKQGSNWGLLLFFLQTSSFLAFWKIIS